MVIVDDEEDDDDARQSSSGGSGSEQQSPPGPPRQRRRRQREQPQQRRRQETAEESLKEVQRLLRQDAKRKYRGFYVVYQKPDAVKKGLVNALAGDARFAVSSVERNDAGERHMHAYYYFQSPRTIHSIETSLPGAHVEVAYATAFHNLEYISKQAVPWLKVGDPPTTQEQKGEMTALTHTNCRLLAEAGDFETLKREYPVMWNSLYSTWHKQHERAQAAWQKKVPDEIEGTCGEWYWGKTGCGKTKHVTRKYPGHYRKDAGTKWWCNYQGQEVVLCEELDPTKGRSLAAEFKQWTDAYVFPAEFKGGRFERLRPTKFVVTSNYHPLQVWNSTDGPAMQRRFVLYVNAGEWGKFKRVSEEEELVIEQGLRDRGLI